MFISENTNSFSVSYPNYFRWVKLLFVLTLFVTFFSACTKDEDEPTPEKVEEERIKEQKKGLVGTWKFTSSAITTPIATDSLDYRDVKATLGAVGVVNNSEVQLNSDGTYKFTNGIIGGGSYVISGKWEYRSDSTFQSDVIQLEGLYNQLLNRTDADRELFSTTFAESFENFQVVTKKEDEITLSNRGIITEQSGGVPPTNILIEGTYTIIRKE